MSSYDCVIPVSWQRLHDVVLAQWYLVLEGKREGKSYVEEFAPDYLEMFRGYDEKWNLKAPQEYLQSLDWPLKSQEVDVDVLRKSLPHLRDTEIETHSSSILTEAISRHAGEELPDHDTFADEKFYGRSNTFPKVQVAGFKSRFRALEKFFLFDYTREKYAYKVSPRAGFDAEFVSLLSDLFFATRSFVGIYLLHESSTWPASDDVSIQGYLAPHEVVRLSSYLHFFEQQTDDTQYLANLFVDRIRRAADNGLGVVTLHEGL